jgi:hypothetical protein
MVANGGQGILPIIPLSLSSKKSGDVASRPSRQLVISAPRQESPLLYLVWSQTLFNQPQILGMSSTLSDTHFSLRATHQIPCRNRRKNKILAGSFNQVAGETNLAHPNLIPSKNALPIGFA